VAEAAVERDLARLVSESFELLTVAGSSEFSPTLPGAVAAGSTYSRQQNSKAPVRDDGSGTRCREYSVPRHAAVLASGRHDLRLDAANE
jgi:hypothetical protein